MTDRIHLYITPGGDWIATLPTKRVVFARLRYETYEEAAARAAHLLTYYVREGDVS